LVNFKNFRIKRRTFLKRVLGASTLLGVGQHRFAFQQEANQPNILLIIADDLGVDKIALYNDLNAATLAGSQPETPMLSRLVDSGVIFRHGWANTVCSPTRASIYTGLYPFRHGVGVQIEGRGGLSTQETNGNAIVTLSQALRQNGYRTGLFGKWHLGTQQASWPISIGWDYHAGGMRGGIADYCGWEKSIGQASTGSYSEGQTSVYATEDVVNEAEAWINNESGIPWFATLAFNAPHTPFHEPNAGCSGCVENSSMSAAEMYAAMVECMDEQIANLLNGMDDAELSNTLIFFVGDNGTPGRVAPERTRSKGSIYQGGVHVPFIAADGAHLVSAANVQSRINDPGRVSDTLVHVTDLYATIAAATGSGNLIGQSADSISFFDSLNDASQGSDRAVLFSQSYTDVQILATVMEQETNHKLNYIEPEGESGCYELYDINIDPDEANNLFNDPGVSETQTRLLTSLRQFSADGNNTSFPDASDCG